MILATSFCESENINKKGYFLDLGQTITSKTSHSGYWPDIYWAEQCNFSVI